MRDNAGDYATALREWRGLAEQGDAWAQSFLGSMYYEGIGVTQDYAEAVRWFRLAAEQGNALGQHDLGMAYLKGQGVSQDFEEAAKWVRLAAEQGLDKSQLALGSLYKKGLGVPQDHQEAAKWLRLAAEQGNALAQTELAKMRSSASGQEEQASAEESTMSQFKEHLMRQLQCHSEPDPTHALIFLLQRGLIRFEDRLGIDGESCFPIVGGIELDGLKFENICGSMRESFMIGVYPDFYWRAPGCCASNSISLGTLAPAWKVNKWTSRNRIPDLLFPDYLNPDGTRVRCSSFGVRDQ